MRESVLNYFVDKIWLYDDKLVISGWFSEDKTEIPFDMVDEVTKNGAAGGFVCRVDCSTTLYTAWLNALRCSLFTQITHIVTHLDNI